jgi:hypothetical protein
MLLAKFVSCCKFYFWLLMDLPLCATSNIAEDSVTAVSTRSDPNVRNTYTEGEVSPVSVVFHSQSEESQLSAVKCLDIDLSRISLTFAVVDESGN